MSTTTDGRVTRGSTNRNARGGSDARRRRREWLVMTYRANVDALVIDYSSGLSIIYDATEKSPSDAEMTGCPWRIVPACRCYRCGDLLTVDTVTVDRIKPGCKGGTYRRENIRPACSDCNSEIGGGLRSTPKKAACR